MEIEKMDVVNLTTTITKTKKYTISVLVHKEMMKDLILTIGGGNRGDINDLVQPSEIEMCPDSLTENTFEEVDPVDIDGHYTEKYPFPGDTSSIKLVLTKDGLVTNSGDLENLKSEDLVWEIVDEK